MSIDLEVWSVRPTSAASFLSSAEWRADAHCWSHEQHRGKVQIWKSDRVEFEDIPKEIAETLIGIEFLTRITVSGSASKILVARANSFAKQLAVACHGVIFNPQTDSIVTPSGVKRFLHPRREATFAISSLSWWTLSTALFDQTGIEQLVASIERLLPEALPRRFGLCEPPQHVYAKTGREYFVGFLREHADKLVVWYPTRPVLSVVLQSPNPVGPARRGFRANHLRIDIETSAFDQPGWESQCRRL